MKREKQNGKGRQASILERLLASLAHFQVKHNRKILLFFIILTLILAAGMGRIEFESDINNEMPQDMPIYQLNDKITSAYGGQDSVLILMEIDQSTEYDHGLTDIRDEKVIRFITALHEHLEQEHLVNDITSAGAGFKHMPKENITTDSILTVLDKAPQTAGLISEDKTATMMIVNADVGSDEQKLDELERTINKAVDAQDMPSGLSITITGNPSVIQTVFGFLQKDSVNTLLIAAAIVFLLLILIERSITDSFLIFIPLSMGILWTLGTLGWLGIKISVATAGLGAMLIGLGVEYGAFIRTRYCEERTKGKTQVEALSTAVPSVGSAMLGSGMTTIVGFLALTLSIMPMLQHLGQSLALGIAYCLVAAILLAPVVFVTQENIAYMLTRKQYAKYKRKKERNEVRV